MPSRRTVLASGAAGVGVVALAACGASSDSGSTGSSGQRANPGNSQPGQPQDGGGTASSATGPDAQALTTLREITVGEAVSVTLPDGSPALVARPSKNTVACFSAICTHMGCTVKPEGNELHCPCHGSRFDASTGKVIHGPAQRPLPAVPVHLAGGKVINGA